MSTLTGVQEWGLTEHIWFIRGSHHFVQGVFGLSGIMSFCSSSTFSMLLHVLQQPVRAGFAIVTRIIGVDVAASISLRHTHKPIRRETFWIGTQLKDMGNCEFSCLRHKFALMLR